MAKSGAPTVEVNLDSLRDIQMDCGLSYNEIARRFKPYGKEPSEISRWFNGIHSPTLENALQLAEIMACTLEDMKGAYVRKQKHSPLADASPKDGAKDKVRVSVRIHIVKTYEFPVGTPQEQVDTYIQGEVAHYNVELIREGIVEDGVMNPRGEKSSLVMTGEYTKADAARLIKAFLSGRLDYLRIDSITIGAKTITRQGVRQEPDRKKTTSREDNIQVQGTVLSALTTTQFKVRLANGHDLIAHLDDESPSTYGPILPGDIVMIAISPDDLSKGIIIHGDHGDPLSGHQGSTFFEDHAD